MEKLLKRLQWKKTVIIWLLGLLNGYLLASGIYWEVEFNYVWLALVLIGGWASYMTKQVYENERLEDEKKKKVY